MVADSSYRVFDPGIVARLKARATDDRFALATARIKRLADGAVPATRMPVPEGGGWTHDYQCPTHAIQLKFDEKNPHDHACPVDGEIHRSEALDAAWISRLNHATVGDLRECAFAYTCFNDDRYLQRARAILAKWAELYPSYVSHGKHAGKGLCMGQSLDEAVWVIDVGQSYDLLRVHLSADEQNAIETRLLRRCGEHLLTQIRGDIHNIECWILAGLATIGRLLNDEKYVAPALTGDASINRQLSEGFLADGWWYEGSPTYHFYTLSAVQALVEAIGIKRLNDDSLKRLRSAYDAPIALARADGSIPPTNDGWITPGEPGYLYRVTEPYEWASHAFGGEHYDEQLAENYASGTKRDSFAAIVYGRDALPEAKPVQRVSTLQAGSGYGILRHTTVAGETWAMLKFGPHGGGHGHPDKPALLYHAFGQRLSDDIGTPGYGISMNKTWYRTTLAHNAPLLDNTNQPPTTGKLIAFKPTERRDFGLVDVEAAWTDEGPYAGAIVRRVLILRSVDSPYLIDVVRVTTPQERTIDLPFHHLGAAVEKLDAAPALSVDNAFAHLSDWRVALASLTIRTPKAGSTIAIASGGGQGFVTASPDNPSTTPRTTIIRRIVGREALFVTIVSPFTQAPIARNVRWLTTTSTATQFAIEGDGLHDVWAIGTNDEALVISEENAHGGAVRSYKL